MFFLMEKQAGIFTKDEKMLDSNGARARPRPANASVPRAMLSDVMVLLVQPGTR